MVTSVMPMRVYLAGPIQHAADYGKGWRARMKDGDIDGPHGYFEYVDPMDKYDTTKVEYQEWTDEQIVEDDLDLIDGCDALFVHWLEVPTCGTPMEVFYAKRVLDIPVVVQTTVPGEEISPWLTTHADAICEGMADALRFLVQVHYPHDTGVEPPEIVEGSLSDSSKAAIESMR